MKLIGLKHEDAAEMIQQIAVYKSDPSQAIKIMQ